VSNGKLRSDSTCAEFVETPLNLSCLVRSLPGDHTDGGAHTTASAALSVDHLFLSDGFQAKLSLPGKTPALNHQLTYKQRCHSQAGSEFSRHDRPQHLTVLAGDSLSDWFPGDLLPNLAESRDFWETSAGMLRRLKLFDRTQPETILS